MNRAAAFRTARAKLAFCVEYAAEALRHPRTEEERTAAARFLGFYHAARMAANTAPAPMDRDRETQLAKDAAILAALADAVADAEAELLAAVADAAQAARCDALGDAPTPTRKDTRARMKALAAARFDGRELTRREFVSLTGCDGEDSYRWAKRLFRALPTVSKADFCAYGAAKGWLAPVFQQVGAYLDRWADTAADGSGNAYTVTHALAILDMTIRQEVAEMRK